MTRQEMFDKAYLGVIAQGRLGKTSGGTCSYTITGEDGKQLHCGIGLLLSPSTLELLRVMDKNFSPVASILRNIPEPLDAFLAIEIQRAHDNADTVAEFLDDMKVIASNLGLRLPEPTLT